MRTFTEAIIIIFIHLTSLYASFGNIYGEIIDIDTHQPLPGANIIIENTDLGAGADVNGFFKIKNICLLYTSPSPRD